MSDVTSCAVCETPAVEAAPAATAAGLDEDQLAQRMAAEYQMDYLGALPLNLSIRVQADAGRPTVVSEPDGEIAGLYKSVARQVAVRLAQRPLQHPEAEHLRCLRAP